MAGYRSDLYKASGFEIDDCCVLGLHYTKKWGYKPDVGESLLIRATPGSVPSKVRFTCAYGFAGSMFTGLWRSSDVVYATRNVGAIHAASIDEMSKLDEVHRCRGAVMDGIWGLDDKHVYAWYKTLDDEPHALFFNGKTWKELPAPPGRILAMHGLAPDFIYAVGFGGLVTRWDGKAWTRITIPTKAVMTSVFVAGADEMYAVGHDKGLWEGSSSGWGRVATGPGSLYGVAKFAGDVWVGAEEHGLWKRSRNKLVCVDAELHAQAMDCRKTLLITATDMLAETSDGKKFTKKAQGLLGRIRDEEPKLWERR